MLSCLLRLKFERLREPLMSVLVIWLHLKRLPEIHTPCRPGACVRLGWPPAGGHLPDNRRLQPNSIETHAGEVVLVSVLMMARLHLNQPEPPTTSLTTVRVGAGADDGIGRFGVRFYVELFGLLLFAHRLGPGFLRHKSPRQLAPPGR
jgi:hypothetical protein